jgi:hypothetical protein
MLVRFSDRHAEEFDIDLDSSRDLDSQAIIDGLLAFTRCQLQDL